MPTPLTPTSSQEIIAISPPRNTESTMKKRPILSRPKGAPSSLAQKPATAVLGSKTISHMSNYASSSTSPSLPSALQDTSSTESKVPSVHGSGSGSRSTTLPRPHTFRPSSELKGKIADHMRADKYLQQIGEVPTPGDPVSSRRVKTKTESSGLGAGVGKVERVSKRKEREEEVNKEKARLEESGIGRERITQRMVSDLTHLSSGGEGQTDALFRCRRLVKVLIQ